MTGRALLQNLWPWVAAALSGLLLALCYPGFNQSWLCWIALIPLITALWFSGSGGKRAWLKNAGLGFCAGIVFFCITFSWLTTVTNLMEPHILATLAWFGLMSYMSLYFALWGWFAGCVARPDEMAVQSSLRNFSLSLLCAAGWVAQEWLRGVVFSGFGWNTVGIALHNSIALIQVTDITGVAGLSFLVVMCNVIAVLTVRRFAVEIRTHKFRPHFDFTLTLALVAIVFAYGVHALLRPKKTLPLQIAAVQANIPENEKIDEAFEQKIFHTYSLLTNVALAHHPQLLIWPEAATPEGMFADQTNYDFVMGIAAKVDSNFILGTLDHDDKGDYNAAMLLNDHGERHQSYRKIHLVPFGEYIPLRHSFPLFAKLAGDLVPGDFLPGSDYTVLHIQDPPLKMGVLICFEDTLGDLTRHFVLGGAQLLVNITNDAWFLKSIASEQQLTHAVFRAAETHRPLVRCANTGVTCIIDSEGRVTQSLRSPTGDTFIEGVLFGQVDVPYDQSLTFYVRHGEWLSIGSLLITASYPVFMLARRRFVKQ